MHKTSIPTFPESGHINAAMRDDILEFISKYPAYHDFSLGNLFCWDTNHSLKISKLNGNLVVRFPSYTNNSSNFLSFLGDKDGDETAKQLLEFSTQNADSNFLCYVPEISIRQLGAAFNIEPVRDDFDYIYHCADYLPENLSRQHNLNDRKNKFEHRYLHKIKVQVLRSLDHQLKLDIERLYTLWLHNKGNNDSFAQEKSALNILSGLADDFLKLWILAIYDDSQLVGFIIFEIFNEHWAIGHFSKADISYKYLSEYLFIEASRLLHAEGIQYINLEPDLGIEGLRISKVRKHPCGFLKKYRVSLKKEEATLVATETN